ncbi:MAG: hypothetical protein HY513_01350 [Candidatus Aenigmarchaeota archaeon]|nr:hypothetical protein [Candidatus Aenigmarchaeota archaeon]
MNSMITVVIFDVGGVLYKPSYKGYYYNAFRHFSKKFDMDARIVENAFRSTDTKIAIGKETFGRFLKKVSTKLVHEVHPEEFLKILNERPNNLDPRMLQLAAKLGKTYKVAVISDDIAPAAAPVKKKLGTIWQLKLKLKVVC